MSEPIHVPDGPPAPTAKLCWIPRPIVGPHAGMDHCDRQAGHGGLHTWELTDQIDDLQARENERAAGFGEFPSE